MLALAVISYGAERSLANDPGGEPPGARARQVAIALGALGVALGALLFAGSLAGGGDTAWPGLVGGALAAALGWAAVGALFDRARGRLKGGAAGLLSVYADAIALALAALAIFLEPVGYLALAAFVLLLMRGRRGADRKYAGLRVLR